MFGALKAKKNVTVNILYKPRPEDQKEYENEAEEAKRMILGWFPKLVTVEVEPKEWQEEFDRNPAFDITVEKQTVLTNLWLKEGFLSAASGSKQSFVKKVIEGAMIGKLPADDIKEYKKELARGRDRAEKDAMDEANKLSEIMKKKRLEEETSKRQEKEEKLKEIREKEEKDKAAKKAAAAKPKAKAAVKAKAKAKGQAKKIDKAEEAPQPAPFTVDLNNPPVDVSAPLDSRDIDLVQQTFARVAALGAENVGAILFLNIFEIAPEAKALFPFGDEDVAQQTRLRKHAGKVVETVATAVSLLGDLNTLVPVLQSLGLKHVGFNVIPAHYDVVGQALIKSLKTGLGEHMTEAVTNAYLKVYTVVKTTMLEKCDYSFLDAATEAKPESQDAVAEEPIKKDDLESSPAEGAAPAEGAPKVEAADATTTAEGATEAPQEPNEAKLEKSPSQASTADSDTKAPAMAPGLPWPFSAFGCSPCRAEGKSLEPISHYPTKAVEGDSLNEKANVEDF